MSSDDGMVSISRAGDYDADPDTGEIPEPNDEAGDEISKQPMYPNVYAFVEGQLAVVYARHNLTGQNPWKWCPNWWAHPEAVSRLDALWQAFEVLRTEPGTGPANWWRDYADPTMAALTSQDGPFEQCGGDKHAVPAPLPTTPPHQALQAEHTSGLAYVEATPGVEQR